MSKSKFSKSRISGIVTVLPNNKKSIDDELELYGGNPKQIERIKQTIGINQRYVVDEKTTAFDLCKKAAEHLMSGMNVKREKIESLIFVTQTPDYFQPCNAALIHGALGLHEDCASFDVNLGCSGYIYGLWLAKMMIETGSSKMVLLLAGDTMSKCVNPRDRSTAPLFGDAGSATLVEKCKTLNESYFILHTDGKGYENLIIPAGAFRNPKNEQTAEECVDEGGNVRSKENIYMNGAEIFNFSIKVEPDAIRDILAYSNKTQKGIDFIIFHQANKYIISNIARRAGIPLEKVPMSTVEKYGNQSSASIPATISDSLYDKVSEENKTIIMSGFGVGLSWATCLTSLNNIYCPNVQYL